MDSRAQLNSANKDDRIELQLTTDADRGFYFCSQSDAVLFISLRFDEVCCVYCRNI